VAAKFDLRKNVSQLIEAYGIRSPTVREGNLDNSRVALPEGRASDRIGKTS
jgi:hypothetical protein